MPMNDGFDPDHALPTFLSGDDEEHEQWVASLLNLPGPSRILGVSILSTAVMAGGIAIALSLGNPVKLFAAMASLPRNSAQQRGADQSLPAIQSFSDIRISATGAEPASQAQTETNEPSAGVLLAQFQAWAAKEDAQAQEPARAQDLAREGDQEQTPAPPVKVAPFLIEADDAAPELPAHRHRKTRSLKEASVNDASVQNARAEIRHVQKSRARVQREQDTLAQQPVQNAPAPSLLQSSWWHQ